MFEKEIADGSEFLDNYYGTKTWVLEIDVGELDLKSGCNCILGQLHGDYDHMLDLLDLDEEDAIQLGFCVDYQSLNEIGDDSNPHWEKLTEEWTAFVKDRMDSGIEL